MPWIEELSAPRAEPARDGSAPDGRALAKILETATTVPDHGGLRPWRFAVITGAGRDRFGDAMVAGLHAVRGANLPDAMVAKMRGKAHAAPCAVMVIASPRLESNVPEWEQMASASCTGYAMVLAGTALGLGAVWKSAAVLDTAPVRALFALDEHERLLGWVNLGAPAEPSRGKGQGGDEASLGELVTVVDGDNRPFGR
ncbi:MAG TPA: nitroreductase [Acidimicrobiales bacterium]|nr:nitroreductase [Acidimicrobiales bacterium]